MEPTDSTGDTKEAERAEEADTTTPPVSSPASTGGAGTTFEQHVGAYWLAQLLVGAIPPILIDSTVTEVAFQTERLGWNTDDLLVVCKTGDTERKLAAQVKRSFTVSAGDKECVQAVGDFWKDFTGPKFSRDTDRLALITLRGTKTLLEHFVGLLDHARAARDGADFEQRLATPGLINATAKGYCADLQKIVGALERKPVTAADIWPFLRVLHVMSLDLHTGTLQAEAQIKSMLALTVTEGDPVASAAASWNELIVQASTAMDSGGSLRHDDLPAGLRARHGVIATDDRRVLRALTEHTAPVLGLIRSTVGRAPELHLPRARLVQEVLDALESAQVVIVTGPAGSGKSAVGKEAASLLARDHFLFGFRVEEFAKPSLDETLKDAQVPASWSKLRAILGAQARKVVLVESVERLLEKTTRDAFSDLMTVAVDDPGLRIVLTCRDYSAELVRASFLGPHRIEPAVVEVPSLDDAELAAAGAAFPALAIPLASPPLRDILRNPFLLDKALAIPWSAEKSLPQNEREFRALFWRDVVRGVVPAMRRPREEVLRAIAVGRARALTAYIPETGLDAPVVESLRGDSLIVSPAENPFLVAPGHDVLEDWSILQWLDEQRLSEAPFKALSEAIGPYPAVRRSYRKWVAELVATDPAAADRLFEAAVSDTEISVQFRDDTLVSLLKAPSAPEFLVRHEGQLLADNRALLRRVIHLLRVACVKTGDWAAGLGARGSISDVPDGPAWAAVLRIVQRNLATFTNAERLLLLRLVEDAVRGVTWWAPRPDGAEDVAAIAHWLLDALHGYRDGDARTRVLKVIARIPGADAARFEAVLRGNKKEGEHRDVVAEEFQQLVFAGTDGAHAARDLPDVIIPVGTDYLLASEDDIDDEHRYRRSLDIDLYFGIKEGKGRDSFPPSALRGPWISLLRHHTGKAIAFYIKVFDHSADWYAHPRLPDRLEDAWEVELTFGDGTTRKQWMNGRLWGLYRGLGVGPYPLLSMLMALESWLLGIGAQEPQILDAVLVDILRRTSDAAVAAVVASAAIAYPHAAGEALLALLSVRDYIAVDRARMAGEHGAAIMAGISGRAGDRIYEVDRQQANARPHRRFDLEAAVFNLQLGPLATRVQALLDKHLAALPPKEQQNEGDQLWRLAIHRMDLRQFTASEAPEGESPAQDTDESEPPARTIRLDAKPPDADLQVLVDENLSRQSANNTRLSLLMWGLQAFQRETDKYDPSYWPAKLAQAQGMSVDAEDGLDANNAPGFVAAVCVRDQWDDLTQAHRDWCVDTICSEVLQHADDTDHLERVQKNSMAADRPCAFMLAALLRKPLDPTRTEAVKTAFAAAHLHPVDEVRAYATLGIDDALWATDRPLALRCLNAIATEAVLLEEALNAARARAYEERGNLPEVMAAATADIRARFWENGAFADDAHSTVEISGGLGAGALKRILAILGRVPQDPLAIAAFLRASHMLGGCWTSDYNGRRRDNRDFEGEYEVSQHIQEFLLRTTPEAAREVLAPLLATIEGHSRDLASVLQGLTGIQDRNPNTPQYWLLWDLIASAVRDAKWLSRLDTDTYWTGSELLSAVFLTQNWNEGVRHWGFLEGYADRVHALFEALPATSTVLHTYSRFLYKIGERSLPAAFLRIAAALRRGDARKMLSESDTVFMLDVLLQRYVYGRPLELKRDAPLRNAVLFILDCLVEAGSSAAFRMRDDFVTPAA
jgi:hypothetical protein